jgi:signal transduction histidine kinase
MGTDGRVDKVFLLHIWACVPFAPLWLFSRGPDVRTLAVLRVLAAVCAAYLALRTWIVFRVRDASRWSAAWPVLDIALVTAILVGIGDAEDPTALLYLLPIAYATLKLSARQGLAVVALAVLAQFGAGVATGTWASYVAAGQVMHVVFRHFFLLLLASAIFFLSREAQRYRALSALADYRRDLSAEMHDGIQHDLALMARRLDLAEAVAAEDPTRAVRIAVEQRETARRASRDLRFLVRQTRPGLDAPHFMPTLRDWCALIADRRGISVVLEGEEQADLAAEYHHAVLRIVQEAVMNAVNHSGAGSIRVRFKTAHAHHRIVVEDDGAGIPAAGGGDGYGLQSMRTRAEALGGRFRAVRAPHGGTRISVMLPLAPPGGKGWPHGFHSGDPRRG